MPPQRQLRHGRPGRQPDARPGPAVARRSAVRPRHVVVAGLADAPAGQPGATGAKTGNHKVRNGVLIGGAAAVLLAAGIGIGHAAWGGNGDSNLSAFSSGNALQTPSPLEHRLGQRRHGSTSSSPFGNSPFSGGSSASSGNTGSGNSGSSNSSGPSDVNAIASKIDPGLVDIDTTLGYQQEQAAGTGIVLSSDGVILTNNHVIDGATTISVTDVGNGKTYTASVVGYDRTKDIAVLQLHNASGLTTANLGNSSTASVGEDVVGVGNAGGTGGTPSAAGGTVTALNQSITASDEGDGTSEQLSGLIETNADIQPGDSGGALVNTSGQVLGIDTAASAGFSFQSNDQSSGTQGFAIPIDTALTIARQIVAGNASSTVHIGTTAFLGVEVSPAGSSSTGSGNNGFGGSGDGGFGGFFGGNTGSTGNTGNTGNGSSSTRRRRDRRRGHQRSGPGGRTRPGRHHHGHRRQDRQLGQRPHQRHQCVPPRRQGERRLHRLLGPDPHVDRATELGPAAVGPCTLLPREVSPHRTSRPGLPGRLVVRLPGLEEP